MKDQPDTGGCGELILFWLLLALLVFLNWRIEKLEDWKKSVDAAHQIEYKERTK